MSPIAISPAGTGSDKASYFHYNVTGDWAGHAQRYGRTYGHLTAFTLILYKDAALEQKLHRISFTLPEGNM